MKMPLNFTKENKKIIALLLLGGLVFFVLYFNLFLKPAIAHINEIRPQLYKFTQDIAKIQQWSNERNETERRLRDLENKVRNYQTILSTESEIPLLLEELSAIAGKSKIKIIGIKPKMESAPASDKRKIPYQEIPIFIEATCGYHQLGYFISELENAKRLFAVRDISIKGNSESTRSHDVSLVVSTFLVAEE